MKTQIKNFFTMELVADENKNPMMTFLTGDVIMTFPLINALELAVCNAFLRSLDTGLDVKFESYRQYGELIHSVGLILERREGGGVLPPLGD